MATIALSVVGASAAGNLAGYRRTPQGALLDLLEDRGHKLVERDSPVATHFVALDHNHRSLAMVADKVPRNCRQLVVFEPRVVLPANFTPRVQRQYGQIIPMTPAASGPGHEEVLAWPQRDWRRVPSAATHRVAGTSALINANKLSIIRGSLYGLRRQVIEAFAKTNMPLTLAGANWTRTGRALLIENLRALAYAAINRERIDLSEWARTIRFGPSINHVGIVDDKESVLLAAEFAVVIENSATYVSEKLFDAVIAGCVPLYVGPPLAEFGIPEGIALPIEPNADAFTTAVSSASESTKSAILRTGREWLDRETTHSTWAMPHALERLADTIHHNINEEAANL